jgi:phosphoribosylaminoimidazole-succinocarboxamide synthase
MLKEQEIRQVFGLELDSSNLGYPDKQHGKVRDWYSLPGRKRLIVTSDRLSAFDRNLAVVPYKGQVLNQLAAWWFEKTSDVIPNHLINLPDPNCAIVQEVEPLPIEVIVRGYITGVTSTALWYRYSIGEREIYGYHFPDGLRKNQKLPEPIITPTTKGGVTGHDERLTCAEVVEKGYLDSDAWEKIQTAALQIFKRGQHVAEQAGLILVDTKYEFGKTKEGEIILIDEVHTPDSSRFWKAENYTERFEQGLDPENFDKEFIRIAYAELGYRGDGQPPQVPELLWVQVCQRYIAIYEMLTGLPFEPAAYPAEARIRENLLKAGVK